MLLCFVSGVTRVSKNLVFREYSYLNNVMSENFPRLRNDQLDRNQVFELQLWWVDSAAHPCSQVRFSVVSGSPDNPVAASYRILLFPPMMTSTASTPYFDNGRNLELLTYRLFGNC
jgi:hypothetical protein